MPLAACLQRCRCRLVERGPRLHKVVKHDDFLVVFCCCRDPQNWDEGGFLGHFVRLRALFCVSVLEMLLLSPLAPSMPKRAREKISRYQ